MSGRYVIAELRRLWAESGRPIDLPPILHLTHAAKCNSEFAPILCDDREGIAMPGSPFKGEPTCPECLALIGGAA